MLDNSEPVAEISEAAFQLVSGDPATVTGGIRYTAEALEDFGATPADIGMPVPPPN
jgi:hypothetical protein